MNIGGNIQSLRKSCGWTQKQLAEKLKNLGLEVSTKTISSWEVNRTEPQMGVIQKLSELFKCNLTDIIGENVNEEYYYLNEETRKIAQAAFENKEFRMLFNATRNASPEDMLLVIDIYNRIKNGK